MPPGLHITHVTSLLLKHCYYKQVSHVFFSLQVVSNGNKPSHRSWRLAVHRWILWQEFHWLSQHLLTPEALRRMISSLIGFTLFLSIVRFVSLGAHWYCDFAGINEKLIIECYHTVCQTVKPQRENCDIKENF